MKSNLATKLGVAAVTVLLLLYVVFVAGMAVSLFAGDLVAKIMGAALIVFPILAVVFVARELLFGLQTERLLKRLADAGELPEDDLPKRPSGRVVREAADEISPGGRPKPRQHPETGARGCVLAWLTRPRGTARGRERHSGRGSAWRRLLQARVASPLAA